MKINNLSFGYEEKNILHNIDISIAQNEFIGFIGPNGAGKSTLLKLICGLLESEINTVIINGKNIESYTPKGLSKVIGYVPQQVNINFPLTVEEIVAMGRYPYLQGFWNEDERGVEMIEHALQWMNLAALRFRPFNELSGGEQQRAMIAGVLAQEASIFILDEPTSALDLRHQQEIYRILNKLVKEENKTVLIVTHDINLAAQFCQRLIILNQGRIISSGPPKDVLKFPLIQEIYGVKVYIDINPLNGSLYILPYDLA
ncbi:MAG: ABC transporter ATP-binding protein [Calditrichaceae bacterium]|nr:ABC transporter ATP-binding protein [Calditrichaceae bacterium]MBN2709256.1 ABC transporter ATP-binding protein [Calditrichaceae bacterium]